LTFLFPVTQPRGRDLRKNFLITDLPSRQKTVPQQKIVGQIQLYQKYLSRSAGVKKNRHFKEMIIQHLHSEMGASGHVRGRTGLSACIFFACGKKGYRFNPLRVR
jgi:hypothetical protein